MLEGSAEVLPDIGSAEAKVGGKYVGKRGIWKTDAELAVEAQARQIVKALAHQRWLIDPRYSKCIFPWDLCVSIALLFTATVTPFEVALLPAKLDWLFILNRIVDGIFAGDVFVNFILIKEHRESSEHGQEWITNPTRLARVYLTSWFSLDLCSLLVSAVDIFVVIMDESSSSSATESLLYLVPLKVLRVLRLFKLVRLVKASYIGKRWQTHIAVSFSMYSLVKQFVYVLAAAHWMACVWVLQCFLQEDLMLSWLGDTGYCTKMVVNNASISNVECQPPGSLYMASLYWAITTLTSIGYGDISPAFNNPAEQAVSLVLMLAGAYLWAHVIATYCGVVSAFNPEQNAFQATMDELNRFLARENINQTMRQRLRGYFLRSRHMRFAESQQRLLSYMSPTLQQELYWELAKAWLRNISFLREAPHQFVLEFARSLHAMVYAPGDVPKTGFMYIVHRGVALYAGRMLTKGRVWGEDIILSNSTMRSNLYARAMNYLEVYFISRRELLSLAVRFPSTASKIRRAAILLELRRLLITAAKQKLGLDPAEQLTWQVRKAVNEARRGDGEGHMPESQRRRSSFFDRLSEPASLMAALNPQDMEKDVLLLQEECDSVPIGTPEARQQISVATDLQRVERDGAESLRERESLREVSTRVLKLEDRDNSQNWMSRSELEEFIRQSSNRHDEVSRLSTTVERIAQQLEHLTAQPSPGAYAADNAGVSWASSQIAKIKDNHEDQGAYDSGELFMRRPAKVVRIEAPASAKDRLESLPSAIRAHVEEPNPTEDPTEDAAALLQA